MLSNHNNQGNGAAFIKATGTGISFASGGALLGETVSGFAGAILGALAIGAIGVIVCLLLIKHASR